jgi:hypothetical protein
VKEWKEQIRAGAEVKIKRRLRATRPTPKTALSEYFTGEAARLDRINFLEQSQSISISSSQIQQSLKNVRPWLRD